jgi:hypothetical protein
MTTIKHDWLYWSPRILGIAFALFISLFALDAFQPGQPLGQNILGFLIHLIPTLFIALALLLAWKWEWVGLVLFLGLAISYVIMAWGQFGFVTYLTISGPLLLISILFGINWLRKVKR